MSVSIVRCVLQRLLPVFFVCVGRSPEGDSLGDERWYRIEFDGQRRSAILCWDDFVGVSARLCCV
jgi:hypothetical protein